MTKLVNVTELIRPNVRIERDSQIIFPCVLTNRKNFLKKSIWEKFCGKTSGKRVMIWTNELDIILPSIQAIWELGAVVVVHDFQIGWQNDPSFRDFYDHIDLIVVPPNPNLDQVTRFPMLVVDSSQVDLENHETVDYHIPDFNEECTAVCTHSSGTTGIPKILDISHGDAIDLVRENVRIFDFRPAEKVMHYKTLHHGSLFLNYAIPAFSVTDDHVYLPMNKTQTGIKESDHDFLSRALMFCKDKQINRWLIPYNWIRYLSNLPAVDLSSTMLVTIMGPTDAEMKTIIEKFRFKKIYNNFGCTEIGTLFVSETDASNVDSYNPNRFTMRNQLIDVEIQDNCFRARFKKNHNWLVIGDLLDDRGDEIWWLGRNTKIKVDDEIVDIRNINMILEKFFGSIEFVLVPDFEIDKIYLAAFDIKHQQIDIDSVNRFLATQSITKNKTIEKFKFFEVDKIRMGMKPSQPLLLYAFRKEK